MSWKLDEVIDNMKARIQALENMQEASTGYKLAKQDEIKWLKYELQEIEEMKNEDIKETELVEEDLRENKKRAYCK